MSSRLISPAFPLRTVTRAAGVASTRCSQNPKVDYVNRNTTNFAPLDESMIASPEKVLSSPTTSLAKSLRHQIKSSTPPSSSLPWPVGTFAKAFEADRKLDRLCKTLVSGEREGKIARAWEPVEKGLWLERFGGPGKTIEKVVGHGTVVMRDVGADGKGYLRVLI